MGLTYNLVGDATCEYCGMVYKGVGLAVYRGLQDNLHSFRIHHSFKCHGCGIRLSNVDIPCDENKELYQALWATAIVSEEVIT